MGLGKRIPNYCSYNEPECFMTKFCESLIMWSTIHDER